MQNGIIDTLITYNVVHGQEHTHLTTMTTDTKAFTPSMPLFNKLSYLTFFIEVLVLQGKNKQTHPSFAAQQILICNEVQCKSREINVVVLCLCTLHHTNDHQKYLTFFIKIYVIQRNFHLKHKNVSIPVLF